MIASLMVHGLYKIGLNNGKFTIDKHKLSVGEVPFVRYALDKYKKEEIQYIIGMQKKFNRSVHLIQVKLDENSGETLENIANTKELENCPVFVYIDIDDKDVELGISDEKCKLVKEIGDKLFDSIIIKDCSNTLFLDTANTIRKRIEQLTGFEAVDVGICSSPLSFNGNACLTAVKARELMASYCDNVDNCPLPTANHECMEGCGCIRYVDVYSDVVNLVEESGKHRESSGVKKKKLRGIPFCKRI